MIIRKIIFTFSAIITLCAFHIPEQTNVQEYFLKAAFVYRFTDYVEWENNSGDVFSIAVLGESEITAPLAELAKDKKIKNKRISVKEYKTINDIPGGESGIGAFQILFVSRNYAPGVENVIAKVNALPVLIISEQSGDGEKGSVINFLLSNNKLKFEVNMKAVSRTGLKISSQLLQHAILVNPR